MFVAQEGNNVLASIISLSSNSVILAVRLEEVVEGNPCFGKDE